MRSFFRGFAFLVAGLSLLSSSTSGDAQQSRTATPPAANVDSSSAGLPDAPDAQEPVGQTEKNPNVTTRQADKQVPASQQQPKRILGLMPNYRAVSAGAIPPPPTSKQAFILAGQNSFDYSSFIFVGLTSLIAKGEDAHPQLGKGVEGYWAYTWRGFVDKTDGNYLVLWALPTMLHEDERFYAKGEGRKFNRGVYAATRVFITPNYQGKNTFNAAELLGRGAAGGISLAYYPSSDRTAGDFTEKVGYAVMRDAATNVFREFWPDIATHVLHMHPQS